MHSKILITIVLLLVVTGTIAKQCYQCIACPKPFKGNEAGVTTVNIDEDEYCQKTVAAGVENRGRGGKDCTPVGTVKYCCKGNLCNGAITASLNVKLVAATVGLFLAARLFH